jgi:hypothetical protein
MAASSALSYTLSCVPIRNKFSRHPVGCFCYALSRLALYLWRRTVMRLTNIRAINRGAFYTALRFEQNEQSIGASQAYRDGSRSVWVAILSALSSCPVLTFESASSLSVALSA